MTKSILVTGGAGYIGSHACKALAEAGYLPIAYDNLSEGHREAVRWGPLVEANVADGEQLRGAIERFDVAAIMHFAAFALVAKSVERPLLYFRNNVGSSLALLEAMHKHQVRHLVFSSTCAVYGIPQQTPIPVGSDERPINPYGQSKLIVERMLHWYSRAYQSTFAALRYFNAAGTDPEGLIGEDHSPETHLIPLVLDAALGRRPHVDVLGTDYLTPDGTAVRDYIHVKDLADAHVQKSIRRGETEIAQRAAITLLKLKGPTIWRRFMVIAFEDVGIGAIDVVTTVVVASSDAAFRKTCGDDIRVSARLAALLSEAGKDRSADYLVGAKEHPALADVTRSMSSASVGRR